MEGDKDNTGDNVVAYNAQDQTNQLSPVSTAIPPEGPEGSITWTGPEFVAHSKSRLWYVCLILISVVIGALIWLITKDKITGGAVVVAAIFFALFAAKKPSNIEYHMDREGLKIGNKTFPFERFRSYAIIHKDSYSSIAFLPLRRFSMIISIYYDPRDEPKITSIVADYLPIDESHKDLIDDILWKLRY